MVPAAMKIEASIIAHAMARVGLPSEIPAALKQGRIVECGPTYRMAERPPWTPGSGTLRPDEFTGLRGVVERVSGSDVDVALPGGRYGGGVCCHASTLRTVDPRTGIAHPSVDERLMPRSRGGVADE